MNLEKLPSGSWRIRQEIKGKLFTETVGIVKPTIAEANNILADKYGLVIVDSRLRLPEELLRPTPNARRDKWKKAKAKKIAFVYIIENTDNGRIKIGMSCDVAKRVYDLETACGSKLVVLKTHKLPDIKLAFRFEAFLHKTFEPYRIHLVDGRWTEWYLGAAKDKILDVFTTEQEVSA